MALTFAESNVSEFQRLCFRAHTDTETVILKMEKLAVAHHPIRRRTGEALGMRDGPVSRILCRTQTVKRPAYAAIIPLGHDSHRDSSSLPEGFQSTMACATAEGVRSFS